MIFLIFILFLQMPFLCAAEPQTPADERIEIFFDVNEPLFINLGPDCYFANGLGGLQLRKAAFPFDWLLTNDQDKLIELLEDDFKLFFDQSHYFRHTTGHLIHGYYHIEFRHEHDLTTFDSKYARRIQRFSELNNYKGKVFFMRRAYPNLENNNSHPFYWQNFEIKKVDMEWAQKLSNVLKKRLPNLDFNLVIVNYLDSEEQMQIVDDLIIFNFKTQQPDQIKKIVDALSDHAKIPLSNGEVIVF